MTGSEGIQADLAAELTSVARASDGVAKSLEVRAGALQPKIGILKAWELRELASDQFDVGRRLKAITERVGVRPKKAAKKAAPR